MNPRSRVLSALMLAAHGAVAADYASDLDYFQEFPVVLSASRLQQPLSEAPNAMTVIDRKMIVASGFRNIPDLFKLVPGMYVSYYKGSSQAIVSYLGTTDIYARRMQVMIDGRSVYLPPASTVDWGGLPITVDDIERIEVIRGPAAASHGANSTQGVISIITRSPTGANARELSVTQGSKGINDVSARFDQHGESVDYRLTLAHIADHGYDDLSSLPNNIPISQVQAPNLLNNSNDSRHAALLNYRADYHPNGIDRFDVQFGFSRNIQGVGFSDKNPSPAAPKNTNGNTYHDLTSNSGFVQVEWLRRLADASELRVQYSHTTQEQYESFSTFLTGVLFANPPFVQSIQTDRDNLEVQHTLQLTAANRLVYGAGYRIDRSRGEGSTPVLPASFSALLPPNYSAAFDIRESRLFAHDEWRFADRWLLNSGAMFERDGMGHDNTSPRVALSYHITPQHTLRTSVSAAYRTPSLAERNPPLLQPGALYVPSVKATTPGLLPEKLLSREIGYLGERRDWGTSLDVRVFKDQVGNGIYITNQKIFANGMSSEFEGVEATVKHSFGPDSDLTVNLAHETGRSNGPALAAAGIRYFVPVGTRFNDKLAGSIPRNSASAMFSQRLARDFSLSAAYYYQDSLQPFDRGGIDFQPIQRRTDVRVAKALRQEDGLRGELALVVQNLLDKAYTEYIASNLFNRRGYVTLTLTW